MRNQSVCEDLVILLGSFLPHPIKAPMASLCPANSCGLILFQDVKAFLYHFAAFCSLEFPVQRATTSAISSAPTSSFSKVWLESCIFRITWKSFNLASASVNYHIGFQLLFPKSPERSACSASNFQLVNMFLLLLKYLG